MSRTLGSVSQPVRRLMQTGLSQREAQKRVQNGQRRKWAREHAVEMRTRRRLRKLGAMQRCFETAQVNRA